MNENPPVPQIVRTTMQQTGTMAAAAVKTNSERKRVA